MTVDRELVVKVMRMLSEHAHDEKMPFRIRFPLVGTENMGYLSIEQHVLQKDKRCIVVAACRKYTDMLVNHFYPARTADEIEAYLLGDPQEIVDSLKELSDSVDDKW